MKLKFIGVAILFLVITNPAFASNQTLTGNTNWSGISPTPTSTDIIQIGNGATLTIDVGNAQCAQLIVGIPSGSANAGNGTVIFVAGSKLTISGTSGVTLGFTNAPAVTGTMDMSLGGTLLTQKITDSVANFIPGNGTITFITTATLPSSAAFATYNNLNAPSNTVTLSQNISVSTLNLGNPPSNSGTFDLGGHNLTTNSISILGGNANTITDSGTSTLTINVPTGTVTYSGALTGAGLTLAKDGLGTLVISGIGNTYAGSTKVLNGTLQLGNPNCLSSAALVLGNSSTNDSGTLDVHGFTQSFANVTVSGSGPANAITNSSGSGQLTLTNANGINYSGGITGSNLTLNLNSSGTFVLSGGTKNTFSGNINVMQGTLAIGADNSLSQSTILTLGNNSTAATFDLAGHNQVVAGLNISGSSTTNTVTDTGAAATFTVGSTISPVSSSAFLGQIMGNLALDIDAGTTLTLGGTVSFAGGAVVKNGTLRLGQAFPLFPAVTLGSGSTSGVLDLDGFDQTVVSLASSGFASGNQVRDTSGLHTLTINQSTATTFGGQSSATLLMNGIGTLTLGQSNSVSTLKVANGTVKCGAANIFTSGNSALVVGNASSTGTFDLNGFSQSVGTITNGSNGANIITTTGGAATLSIQNVQPNNPFSYLGQINNQLGLIISTNSSSPFTYAGGSYSNGTTVSAGGVILPMGASVGGPFVLSGGPLSGYGSIGSLTVNPNAVVSPGDNVTTGTLSCQSADFSNGGLLKIKIPSNAAADQLSDSGSLTLGGTSQLVLDLTGYGTLMPTQTFNIVQCSSISGTFNSVQINNNTSGYAVNVNYTINSVQVVVGAIPVITPNAFPAATAGVSYNYNIVASNNPSSYSASGLPPGLSINTGNGSITGTPTTAGNYSVTLTATNKGGTSSPPTILPLTVNPGAVAKLQILLPGESPLIGPGSGKTGTPTAQTAGVSFSVVVNAVDANWNVVPSVNDTVSFSSNDAFATLPANTALINGTLTLPVTLKAASPNAPTPSATVTVSDVPTPAVQPSLSSQITVNPAAFTQLQLILPGESPAPGSATGKTGTPAQQQATQSFTIQVNAVDSLWNVVHSVTDTVTFSSTDPKAVLPPNTVLNSGSVVVNATLNLGPTQTITVSDFSDGSKTAYISPSITVRPGAFIRLQVLAPGETNAPGTPSGKTGTPTAQTGGSAFQITVNAVDVNYTIVPVNDVVQLSTSDPAPVLPAAAPLAGGIGTFNVTLTTGPAQTVSASDVTDPSKLSGTSSSIAVNTITSTLASISPNAGVLNGAAFTLTVTGTNFLNSSVVQWKGSNRPTTFVSATQLTAQIPASDLTVAGRANVTVFTPPPGTGATPAIPFFVYSGTSTGTWIVTNTNDAGQGSLRFAMSQMQTGDTVIFDPNVFDLTSADAATVVNVLSALPTINQGSITIDAQDRRVSVNGSGAGSSPGFEITSSNNKILGISVLGFTQSGIQIHSGAQNNTIGGSRLTGQGPNGQGLRLSNNGSYGIEIDDAGTTGNVVKGCWVGLDSSGTNAESNLAGIIIQNGAQQNTIGGTGNGEANVISGNKFEGITITGTGSDNNTIIGNVIGMSGVVVASRDELFGTRSSVGNGSAGMFLSKGTQGSTVGGDTDAEGNLIGSNGGNGIEVRAKGSKHNKSKGNRITGNAGGGIALFDGSNDGIQPPTINGAAVARSAATIVNGRALSSTTISGTASGDGTVEVFNDTGSQGGTLLTRTGVTNGVWQVTTNTDTTQNITATFTDTNGNTSAFAVYNTSSAAGTVPGLSNLPTDLQTALSALTADPVTTFFGGQAAAAPSTLTVNLVAIKLNLASTGQDTIQTAGTLPIASGFSFTGQVMAVDVGGVAKMVTLDSKGSANGTVAVKFAKPKNGTSKFTVKFGKGAYAATLTAAGIGATSGSSTVPVYVVFNKTAYSATPSVPFVVKAGKSATGKFTQK